MKALVWEAPRVMKMREMPEPQMRLGEFSGIIVDIEADAKSRFPNLRAGREVTVNPLTFDGTGRYGAEGDNHLCVSHKLIGAHRQAFAELVSVPAQLVMPLADGMSMRAGALSEPGAVGHELLK